MRVLHILGFLDDQGAAGGPVRVALNDAHELMRRGHGVEIWSIWRGGRTIPHELQGVALHLRRGRNVFPPGGIGSLYSIRFLYDLYRRASRFDAIHVHAGRDLITQSAMVCLRSMGLPYLVQPHGMIVPDERYRSRLVDRLLTRSNLAAAAQVFHLNAAEERALSSVTRGRVGSVFMPNGVAVQRRTAPKAVRLDILFCSRLQSRKRPLWFVEMALAILGHGADNIHFAIVGPDGGELQAVQKRIAQSGEAERITYEGALSYDDVIDRIAKADLFVLPSFAEPFPMALLEAMSLGVPAVCMKSCGIAGLLEQLGAAAVADDKIDSLIRVVQHLISDRAERLNQGRRGQDAVSRIFRIELVIDSLLTFYKRELSAHRSERC